MNVNKNGNRRNLELHEIHDLDNKSGIFNISCINKKEDLDFFDESMKKIDFISRKTKKSEDGKTDEKYTDVDDYLSKNILVKIIFTTMDLFKDVDGNNALYKETFIFLVDAVNFELYDYPHNFNDYEEPEGYFESHSEWLFNRSLNFETTECHGNKCRRDISYEEHGVWCISCHGKPSYDILDTCKQMIRSHVSFKSCDSTEFSDNLIYAYSESEIIKKNISEEVKSFIKEIGGVDDIIKKYINIKKKAEQLIGLREALN